MMGRLVDQSNVIRCERCESRRYAERCGQFKVMRLTRGLALPLAASVTGSPKNYWGTLNKIVGRSLIRSQEVERDSSSRSTQRQAG